MDNQECRQVHSESSDGAIGVLAAEQFGVFSRAQAIAAGFTPRQIQRRVGTGRWDVALPCVYRISGAGPNDRQSAMAAALWGGDCALVSHATAGVLWGIEGVRARKVELWVPQNHTPRSTLVAVHRGKRLDRADRTALGPIPITTPVRTLIDMAGRMENEQLLAAVESVFRRDLGTPARLQVRVAALRSSGRPGLGRLQTLLDGRGDGGSLESRLEVKTWLLLQQAGVPLPVRQHWVVVGGGRYRLDFAWPELRVGLECEGWEHHGGRAAFGKDRARYAELAAIGWRLLPVTWDACTRQPARVLRWIRAAVTRAA